MSLAEPGYRYRQPYDGLTWSSLTFRVYAVDPTGPGAQAGLRPGDWLVGLDGHAPGRLESLYAGKVAGDEVAVLFWREAHLQAATLTLSSPPLNALEVSWARHLFHVALALLPPVLIHFHLLFPRPVLFPHRVLGLGLLYGSSLPFALPAAVVSLPRLDEATWYAWWRNGLRGGLARSLAAWTALNSMWSGEAWTGAVLALSMAAAFTPVWTPLFVLF